MIFPSNESVKCHFGGPINISRSAYYAYQTGESYQLADEQKNYELRCLIEVLVGDITYVPLSGSNLAYLAAWMDLFSRKIKGWSLAEHMEEELVHSALQKAIGLNQLVVGSIVHSDRAGRPVPWSVHWQAIPPDA